MGTILSCTKHRKPHQAPPRNRRKVHRAPLTNRGIEMDFNRYRYDKANFLAKADYQSQLLSDLECRFKDPLPKLPRLQPLALAPANGMTSCCECSVEYSERMRRCPNPRCGHRRCWLCKEVVTFNHHTIIGFEAFHSNL